MVLIDEEYIKENKKVTAHLLAAFRYGREDLDVLGLTFRKDLISETFQVFPQAENIVRRPLSRLQERLKRKLGANAYPFWFEVAPKSASSVTLQVWNYFSKSISFDSSSLLQETQESHVELTTSWKHLWIWMKFAMKNRKKSEKQWTFRFWKWKKNFGNVSIVWKGKNWKFLSVKREEIKRYIFPSLFTVSPT